MKKIFPLIFFNAIVYLVAAQLPVDTLPHNRNVILEEFTGIDCHACPSGHKYSDSIVVKYPGRAFTLNLHQGHYAIPEPGEPDFRTEYGDSIAMQTALIGYPAGTLNRHYFPGLSEPTGTAVMNRHKWDSAAAALMMLPSNLNVGIEASIDTISRLLTIDIEVYYTAGSTVQQNFLNVALVQDSVLGPQDGSMYYPQMVVGNLYQHNHILRHFLTGQWGDTIPTTSQGSRFVKQYIYTVPEMFPDSVSGGVIQTDVLLSKCRVLAFVTLDKNEIITGCEAPLAVSTLTALEEYHQPNGLIVFPNPVTSQNTYLNFYFPSIKDDGKIQIFNLTGNKVGEVIISAGSNMQRFKLPQLQRGFYVAKIHGDHNSSFVKFVVE